MLGRIVSGPVRRNFSTSAKRRFYIHPDDELRPLANMPFRYHNIYSFTAKFALFCSSGFSLPFFMVRYHLKKK